MQMDFIWITFYLFGNELKILKTFSLLIKDTSISKHTHMCMGSKTWANTLQITIYDLILNYACKLVY